MSEPARTIETNRKTTLCSAEIILVDYIFGNLAKVVFKVTDLGMTGRNILYCDTWWLLREGRWDMIPHEKAEGMIVKDGELSVTGK